MWELFKTWLPSVCENAPRADDDRVDTRDDGENGRVGYQRDVQAHFD
jgi:hypothetical protein